uniref:Uncharacterized protein n=1 Tax=Arundo donax TaxID=35708 RepID=A0A0A9E9M1_ARUDO
MGFCSQYKLYTLVNSQHSIQYSSNLPDRVVWAYVLAKSMMDDAVL